MSEIRFFRLFYMNLIKIYRFFHIVYRRAQLSCREKERHLGQLKERLDEIEQLMSASSNTQLVQCAQFRQRLAEREEEFAVETEALVDRHEHRMRQMNQELSDLRTELARKNKYRGIRLEKNSIFLT